MSMCFVCSDGRQAGFAISQLSNSHGPAGQELIIELFVAFVIEHFVISFNDRVEKPVAQGLSSANTARLSDAELLAILDAPPEEEK